MMTIQEDYYAAYYPTGELMAIDYGSGYPCKASSIVLAKLYPFDEKGLEQMKEYISHFPGEYFRAAHIKMFALKDPDRYQCDCGFIGTWDECMCHTLKEQG